MKLCSVHSCNDPLYLRGYCSAHYCRWKRHKDPLFGRNPPLTPLILRVIELIDTSNGLNNCWIYKGEKQPTGYGKIRFKGKYFTVTRIMYELVYGKSDPNKQMCHSCDNPSCVNPLHLWEGTRSENAQDSIKKGRFLRAKGENSAWAKLTTKQIIKIRELYNSGVTQPFLAKKYDVRQGHISKIIRREIWKHI